MANFLPSLKTLSIKMNRELAVSLTAMGRATAFAYNVATNECRDMAEYFDEPTRIHLVFFIAKLNTDVKQADLNVKLRIVAPRTFSAARGTGSEMANKKEEALLGRPTRINFRLHLPSPSGVDQREEVYKYAERERERAAQFFMTRCQIESIKFDQHWNHSSTALINLVIPDAVGFGATDLSDLVRRAN
jgi:hypothetical protein